MTDTFQQSRLARVMAQLEAPVLTLDLTGYLTSWNRGAENLFGYTSPRKPLVSTCCFCMPTSHAGAETQLAEVMPDHGSKRSDGGLAAQEVGSELQGGT
jgi:hypothetical protein